MKAKFKELLSLLIACMCSIGISAQDYVKVDAAALGLGADPVELVAGTEVGRTESFVMRTAFDDTYKLQDVKANDCDLWVFDGTEITTDNGFMGQTNPKDVNGANPATTTPPTVPVSGAVIEIEALKDGYVYVWGKLSSHKSYMVSENGQPMGYQLVMQTPTFGILDITITGSDEYNYVYEPIAWPEVVFTGDSESTVKENGMGVIKFPVFTGCKYLVNGTGTKIYVGGAWFDVEGDVEVAIASTSDTTSYVLMGEKNHVGGDDNNTIRCVGEDYITLPISINDNGVDYDLEKVAIALGFTDVAELLEGYYLRGMKSDGTYDVGVDPINSGLMFNMGGAADVWGNIGLCFDESGNILTYSNEEISAPFVAEATICFEVDFKRFVIHITLLDEMSYQGGDIDSQVDEIYEWMEANSDMLLPGIGYTLEDEINLFTDATTDEEMKAAYIRLDSVFNNAKESVALMKKLTEDYAAFLDEIGATNYPGVEAAVPVIEEVETFLSLEDEEANYQSIIEMSAKLKQAHADYRMSQIATFENPADYTFLISNPSFEEQGTWTWTIDAAMADSFIGDCRPNEVDGNNRSGVNLWGFNIKSIDVHQELVGIPNGYYKVSAELLTQTGYATNQHVYATSVATVESEPLTEGGWDECKWTELITENYVVVADNRLTIGAASTQGGSQSEGWFQATNFKLYYYGQDISAEALLPALEKERTKVEDFIAMLDEMNLMGIKEALTTEYAKTELVDTTSVESIDAEIQRLRDLLSASQAGVDAYNELGEYILTCEALVAQNPSEGFSAALTEAKSVYDNVNASADDYVDAYKSLKDAYLNYYAGSIDLSSLTFNNETWINGEWYVGLNTTYHVACVYECQNSDSVCVVPEVFEYNGEEYTTIGLGRYNGYYWNNIWGNSYMIKSVQLPATLRFLGTWALSGCNALKEINIPASVEYIGNEAFASCHMLTEIILPDSLESIGGYAFTDCSSLKSMTIPANVTSIGDAAFSNCPKLGSLYCLATTPPMLNGNLEYSEIGLMVYVPEGSALLYRSADYWENYLILEGDGVTVEVDVETPGTLGEKMLEHVDYLYEVNHLVVSGELNEVDLRRIKSAMPYLITIDMSGVEMKTLPESMFYGHKYLMEATLPENLMVIGNNAFNQCRNLTFVNIPEGVIRIGHYAFENCDGLERLVCPSTLNSIGSHAFYSCESLTSVELNEGLDSLENRAFADCINLTEVVLPSSLISFSVPFNWCHNIKSVTCRALIPPYLNNNYDIFSGVDKTSCVLYVPEWTLNVYRLASGWDSFVSIMPLVGYLPENINVMGNVNLTLPESLPVDYRANVSLNYSENSWEYGSLTLNSEGECVLPVGKFHMVYDANRMYDSYNGWNETQAWYTTLINNTGMRADSISITLYNRNDVWNFFSFPYDVKVSEIVPLYANSDFVIRKYSGEERANGNMANTWQNMTADSTLRAGEGYIWHSSRYTDNWDSDNWWCGFEVPAVNNSNKNLIFANGDRTVTLNEYLSEYSHNRSWNLIGNPYPAYYDTRAMDYTAPITVWNAYNGSYYAYSPVDDEYILCPGEAFFVQRPVDTDAITFRADGRQADRVVRNRVAETRAKARNTNNRQVFNLTLSNGVKTDRTRFVINSDAARDYEMNRDANKFMSDDACIPQLYTIEGGVKYAINERPMDNGVIALGAHFGNNGSYTIALNTQVEGMSVVLVDKMTGAETDLMEDSYTFTAEAGTVNTRFEICMKIDEEDGDAAGLESLNGKVAVKAVAGKIVVTAPYESAIEVYNAEGQRVTAVTAASATLDVEPGVYVVKIQDAVHKVSVAR